MPAAFSFPIPSHTLPSLSSRQIRPAAPFSSRWIQARSRPARHRRRAPPPLPPSSRAPLPSLSRLLPLPEAATPPPPPPDRRGLSRRRAPRIRLPGPPRAPLPASPTRSASLARRRPDPPSWVVRRREGAAGRSAADPVGFCFFVFFLFYFFIQNIFYGKFFLLNFFNLFV